MMALKFLLLTQGCQCSHKAALMSSVGMRSYWFRGLLLFLMSLCLMFLMIICFILWEFHTCVQWNVIILHSPSISHSKPPPPDLMLLCGMVWGLGCCFGNSLSLGVPPMCACVWKHPLEDHGSDPPVPPTLPNCQALLSGVGPGDHLPTSNSLFFLFF